MAATIRVPVAAEDAAACLEGHEGYRVLRRMPEMRRSEAEGVRADMLIGVAVDVETSGTDHDVDVVIELALQRFWADANGRIVLTGRPRSWLEDPGRPLSPEIIRLTGLTDERLRGRRIFDVEAASLIRDADFVVAHNASFDRPFIEARLPECAGRPWVCSLKEFDWRVAGFDGGRLGDLLTQMGLFFPAHRASDDVTALLHLIDHRLADGRTVLRSLVDAASRPTFRVAATGAPFETKDMLKRQGYRWNSTVRVWSRVVSESELPVETEWLAKEIYGSRGGPDVERITWRTRHSRSASG